MNLLCIKKKIEEVETWLKAEVLERLAKTGNQIKNSFVFFKQFLFIYFCFFVY